MCPTSLPTTLMHLRWHGYSKYLPVTNAKFKNGYSFYELMIIKEMSAETKVHLYMMPIALVSSHAIANAHVMCRYSSLIL
jgi:hypothetical protein